MKRTAIFLLLLPAAAGAQDRPAPPADTLELLPVEVRSTRASQKAPFARTELGRAAIERQNLGQDLPYLLAQTPSTVVSSDAGTGIGYTGLRIRGTDLTRINVTLNGIPYNDPESQGVFFVDLPDFASSLGSVQVQRGVGTSSNGPGAFGASINLSTNEVRKTAYAEVFNTFGSFNTWRNTVKAGTGLLKDHFTVDARLSRISSDGFIDRGSSDLKSYYLSGAWLGTRSSLRFNAFSGNEKTYQAWNGIPEYKLFYNADSLLTHYYNNLGSLYFTPADSANLFGADPRRYNGYLYANQTDNFKQNHYQLFLNHRLNSGLALGAALFLTHGEGYYEEYKYGQKYSSYGLPNYTLGGNTLTRTDLVRQLWLKNDLYGATFSAEWKRRSLELTFGGSWTRFDGQHFGTIIWAQQGVDKDHEWYRYPARKDDANVYGKLGYTIAKNLSALVDLQYRSVNHLVRGTRKFPGLLVNRSWNFFNPKAGLRYEGRGWSAFASYAVGQKEPNRTDFETGAGITDPRPEKLHDFELGAEHRGEKAQYGVNGYYMRYKDQLVLTGKLNDVGDAIRVNVPKSYRLGIEAWGGGRINRWLSLQGNITLSRNRLSTFTDYVARYDAAFDFTGYDTLNFSNTPIAFSPDLTSAATVVLTPGKGLEFSLVSKSVSRQYLDNTGSERKQLRGYFVQDAELRYTLPLRKASRSVELFARVNNLWNRKYESNGYTYSYVYDNNLVRENFYYPMAGTNVLTGLNIRL
ncbi:TonB-dependent receptor [Flaviaesturariibacter aridisoli]|uniref:TonB-dependent receptor n=1 Tax=Flaviaesturariibacter aridisoli TaxID=2545761 RepID=A0A4R4E3S5_9BACT|nr:TonB-dependent receptor plug domain-containing protein [Flaviaesturariibacter aridisoli]TCZ74186.1 TonB-dependent receptor [Flaviaesturariibacter aridisoli]